MQSVIVALILAACAVYIARRLWLRFTTSGDCGCGGDAQHCIKSARCAGCPLATTCRHVSDSPVGE